MIPGSKLGRSNSQKLKLLSALEFAIVDLKPPMYENLSRLNVVAQYLTDFFSKRPDILMYRTKIDREFDKKPKVKGGVLIL